MSDDYLAAFSSSGTEGGSPLGAFAMINMNSVRAGVPEPEDWTRAFKLLSNPDWASAAKVCAVMADAKTAKATLEKIAAAATAAREEIAKAEQALADLARAKLDLKKAELAQQEQLAQRRREARRWI
jgi:hypothetical protein